MHDFGTTREQLARVAVHDHEMGVEESPNAHYRNKLTLEQVVGAGDVAEPLGVLDCAPLSDGAAAVVLGPLELAKQAHGHSHPDRRERGRLRHDGGTAPRKRSRPSSPQWSPPTTPSAVPAAPPPTCGSQRCTTRYTISALVALEDLGFVEKGKAGPEFASGRFGMNGSLTVNPSGGLKAQGRPFGAVGVAQVVEIVRQLRGEAKDRQVSGATFGLTHDVGGTGATTVVHLLERTN